MNAILKVLSQFPNLEVTNIEHDTTKLLIEFRIRHDNWPLIMENLSKMMPDIILAKRYFSEGGEFGYRWIILKIGSVPEEHMEEFARRIEHVLFEMPLPSKVKQVATPTRNASPGNKSRDVFLRVYEDEDGSSREETHFPLPHVKGEVGAPNERGAGVYKKEKEMARAWGIR